MTTNEGPYKIIHDPDNNRLEWCVTDDELCWKTWFADQDEADIVCRRLNHAHAAGRASRDAEVHELINGCRAALSLIRDDGRQGGCKWTTDTLQKLIEKHEENP